METIICTHCDLVSERPTVSKGYVAKCSRCNHAFIKADTVKPVKILALAITALIIMVPAYTFPLISVHLLGITEDSNLMQGALMMTAMEASFYIAKYSWFYIQYFYFFNNASFVILILICYLSDHAKLLK